jgi:hypothetical protein
MENYVHNIITPKFSGFIIPIILAFIFVFLSIACIGIIYSMKNTTINIGNGFLTVKSLFYGKSISLDEINVDGIKQLNLYNDKDYNVKIRTNGIGLPNYYTGWMKLNNGNKALVYLTARTNVVLIPTNNYDVLISFDDFDGAKAALNRMIN